MSVFWRYFMYGLSHDHRWIDPLTRCPRIKYHVGMVRDQDEYVEVIRGLLENSRCPYDGDCQDFRERCPYHRAEDLLEREAVA